MYLVTTEQFEVDGELFYEGVSWKEYVLSETKDNYIITYNSIEYLIPVDKVIETPRFTREQNIPFGEYQYRTHSDKHTEFFEPVKEYFGIDMKDNYAAQFRDGINPHKDINGSIFKENPD